MAETKYIFIESGIVDGVQVLTLSIIVNPILIFVSLILICDLRAFYWKKEISVGMRSS